MEINEADKGGELAKLSTHEEGLWNSTNLSAN